MSMWPEMVLDPEIKNEDEVSVVKEADGNNEEDLVDVKTFDEILGI